MAADRADTQGRRAAHRAGRPRHGRCPVHAAPPRPAIPATKHRTDYERGGTAWTTTEVDVLDALAAAGGDLPAHRTVHLEDL